MEKTRMRRIRVKQANKKAEVELKQDHSDPVERKGR